VKILGKMKSAMSYAIIPDLRGRRAAKHWLRNIAPDRVERMRKHYRESIKKVEHALGDEADLLRTLKSVVGNAEFFGRVRGLREGLELYEYGLRIQEKNTEAFRSVMRFVVRCAEGLERDDLKKAISAQAICDYLDKEITRIEEQKTSSVNIRPPEKWGCKTWKEALQRKRSNVDKLLSDARSEALSQTYCTLMAWKTWGETGATKAAG